MGFGQSGWFTALLEQELAQHQPLDDARAPGISPRARARTHVRMVLQDSGLLYGTPERVEHPVGMTREEQLSLAVLRTLVRLALDLADISGLGPERRVERLTILFAAWSGHLRLAETLQTALRSTGTLPRRSVARLETLLEDRAMSLGGGSALRAPAPQRRRVRGRTALRPPRARGLAPHPPRPRAREAAPLGGGPAEGAPGRGAHRARLRRSGRPRPRPAAPSSVRWIRSGCPSRWGP